MTSRLESFNSVLVIGQRVLDTREIQTKNKLVRESAVTRIWGSCTLLVMGSCHITEEQSQLGNGTKIASEKPFRLFSLAQNISFAITLYSMRLSLLFGRI